MSFSKKTLFVGVIIVFLIGIVYFNHNQSSDGGDHSVNTNEKNEQQKAEEYAEKMKPKIKEKLKKDDIHHFVNDITFDKDVSISPMGMIELSGYVNNNPEKFSFDVSLRYGTDKVDSIGYDKDLADRFENWDDFDKEVKEDFLNSLSKEEREQYLKDIGEIK
ncbi:MULTISPECIES: DUF1433 domain-containing protein [Bacillus]|uniref:DUF1433 domain-containing protein n=1 Tax=Bacillus TaxID=1386 RepID=UPI000B43629B|nr:MULTISPECIES: DUF1433 domain-containing protein [Bacillus]MBL3647473.1 DUF1433 domain-containing protein [Bacillus sp. RHFS10]MCI3983327.1 DUF1433 domain-containing protein [Bacillus vallismortis]MCI4137606.1 DUF1433 domain-containing protein [Bacillus vallismortis]MEC1791117.1 DUF1433 domain-containing protein [Bacillus vallismortis]